jgi:hypothetical protein
MFDAVERASKAIQTAMAGKAARLQYRQLWGAYMLELSIVEPRVTSARGRQALAEYEAALKGLTDLDEVWEAKDTSGSELLPIRDELAGRVAHEYALPVNTNEPPSIYADEAMQASWQAAQKHLRAASLALGFGP